ncbi:hypothetical protein SmJEL517_g00865 [Synchytrium microbalum]|uniref:Replication protein A subunit n=1 Tax=Synchytrium microbalum TaxID=1806994 RepID=A0A507CC25_9FUNG|nr:uncharacterized protein SmJEL517_g00865 [Synchytrium microbalum]TPX37051.1 hypothetical protein SmJEL517_g00865 [Synchytrium microbalum]
MGTYQLTPGFLPEAANGTAESQPAMQNPLVQVLNVKAVDNTSGKRYRLIISDGQHYMQAMLATQLNSLMDDGQVGKNALIRLKRYLCNPVPNKSSKLLIILEVEVVAGGDGVQERIGNPVAFFPDQNDGPQQAGPTDNNYQVQPSMPTMAPQQPQQQSYNQYGNQQYGQPQYNQNQYSINQTTANRGTASASTVPVNQPPRAMGDSNVQIFPIKWTIRVRCMGKSDVRHFKNQKGDGRLFSVTFYDESGEIRATGFGDAVNQFYDMLQDNSTYLVSKGTIKAANKQFNNTDNDYEMTLDSHTIISVSTDPATVPQLKIKAHPLSELLAVDANATIDVLGVVKDCGDLNSITTKAGRPANKRDLSIVDTGGYQVRATLWGKQAETFDGTGHPVIAIKGVKVGDFQGRSLSALGSSTVLINPDIPDAHSLRGWFDRDGMQMTFQSYTSGMSGGGPGSMPNVTKVITAIRDENLGMGDKPDYINTKATITHIKRENMSYPACPTCNKKMGEDGGGWRCEKCDKVLPQPTHRYLLNMTLSDHTGVVWATAFNTEAEMILGVKADDLARFKEEDEAQFNSIIEESMFKTFDWTLRLKQDTFNDETRVRITAQSAKPLDNTARIEELRLLIAEYGRM